MRVLRLVLSLFVVLFLGAAGYFGVSRWQDQQMFREVIAENVAAPTDTAAFVQELNSWVYHKEGFEQCQARYVWAPLGPTPAQVFDAGGDCADKSRLLSAMLGSVGIPSTLVMLHPCRDCAPTHTIVNAYVAGDSIAADPVYDLVFPDPSGGYYGVQEVRDDPQILLQRLTELKQLRGPRDKIRFHADNEMKYGFPKTVNWDRDPVFRTAGAALASITDEPFLITRPRLMEDPKLFLAWASLGFAAACAILLLLIRRRPR